MEITIAYLERNIMECSLVVIVSSVNAGKVINTRREVVEAVILMLLKSLILCVHLEASWSSGTFPRMFFFLSWSLFFTDGKYKGIRSQRGSVIFELCKCMLSFIFTFNCNAFKIEDGKPFENNHILTLYISSQHIH